MFDAARRLTPAPAPDSEVGLALTATWLARGSDISSEELAGVSEQTLRAVTSRAISEAEQGRADKAFMVRLKYEWNRRFTGGR